MIKNSTVIKRMVKDSWRPAAIIAGTTAAIFGASYAAEAAFGVDADMVYWGLVLAWFVGVGVKWSFEMKRDQIKWEQERMMRDLERKHL